MEFDKDFLDRLFKQAGENARLRQNFDLRTSAADTSQRMLNALLPGTSVPVHRHADTTETVICLCGRLDEVIYEEVPPAERMNTELPVHDMPQESTERKFREVKRMPLCPREGKYGCQIPQGAWHTIEVMEPSVIFEAKDGAYKK